MGQKVSPVGLRIGINKGWESNWYAEGTDIAKNIEKDHKIRKYLAKSLLPAYHFDSQVLFIPILIPIGLTF